MNMIQANLNNFSVISNLNSIFPDTEGFEYTNSGVIRSIAIPECPKCGRQCRRNGWDSLTHQNLASIKIGKFICTHCGYHVRTDTHFWHKFIIEWKDTLSNFFLRLVDGNVSDRLISALMDFLKPMSKDTVLRKIFKAINKLIIPEFNSKYQFVHYDEQYPKKGRHQKYRLALLEGFTNRVIAEELYDEISADIVKAFLQNHLDAKKDTIITTDDNPWYPQVFKQIWGNKVKHQLCLLHLNKNIVKDCGKVKSLLEMYNTYSLLDIFYDRSKELQFIETLLAEEEQVEQHMHKHWIKEARKRFNIFVRSLEKMRRREGLNLKLRNLADATKKFNKLKTEKQLLQKPLQKRVNYIEKNWDRFTLFYHVDCPHTNNAIENYFSTSLKTHKKKQFRTEKGIKAKMKLSRYKRNVGFEKPVRSFLEWGKAFWLIGS